MKINQAGIDLVKSFEGLELKAYRDIAGVLTIGYGHTGPDVVEGMEILETDAETLLRRDIASFEEGVESALYEAIEKGFIGENEFSAMVSLAYNVGIGAFKGSSVARYARRNDDEKAADSFLLWNKARIDGKLQPVAGLTRRRKAERALYLTADEVTSDAHVEAPGGLRSGCKFLEGILK